MAMIIKKNGDKEEFDKSKLIRSVQKAALDVGVSISRTKLTSFASRMKHAIDTKEIRSKVIAEFSEIEGSWERFDRKYKL